MQTLVMWGFFPPQTKLSGALRQGQGKKHQEDVVSFVWLVIMSASSEASQDSHVSWPVMEAFADILGKCTESSCWL